MNNLMSVKNTGEKERIFLVGANGHAKVIIDIIEKQQKYDVALLYDTNPALEGVEFYGYRIAGSEHNMFDKLEYSNVRVGIAAVGDNRIRARIVKWLTARSVQLVSAVHPSAQIGRGVEIGDGTVVMAGAVINSDSHIGDNVIINTKASVDHDCHIHDLVHIAPGATLCGGVSIGEQSFICAGVTVLPGVTIGEKCTIGAGAVVTRDVADGVTEVGVPAVSIETKKLRS
jgi:sugar O-acyltransferase (sialic acid O-acetyltransferase NeuD family)